jgi:peptidoglycan/LPS O-acetylase OafA/YrhL
MLLAVWSGWRAERGVRSAGPRATAALVVGGFAIAAANAYWHATAAPRATNAWLAVLSDVPAGLGFALVVGAAVVGGGTATRWMSARPLAWVGLVSYGVYLWHVPLILFARRLDALPNAYPLRLLVVVPPVLLVAAASWYLVERPLIARAARRRPDARETRRGGRAQPRLEAHAAP